MMYFKRQLSLFSRYLLFAAIASISVQCMAQNKMKAEFKDPPSSVKTGTYWYWIEGNISKEGVIKDLEAMKAAGINRAFIANIGGAGTGDPNASRKVEFMSDEWWNITHAALKKATELDIEIGIFNSPGWSQSGGPWIKPEETMRYLASSQKILKGPGRVSIQLPQPTEHFQDVKVLAFPNPTPEGTVLDMANADITVTPYTENVSNLVDGDIRTGMSFHGEGGSTININTKQPFTARSIVVRTTPAPIHTDVELQAKGNDGTFKTVSRFLISRVRDWKKVGFDPYADVAITFEPTTSNEFRVIFASTNKNTGISELTISSIPRVERFKEKSLAKLFQTEVPSWDEYLWREQPEKDERKYTLNPGQVIDISDKLSANGLLNWEVPEGEWMVIRTGMAPTGVVNEPACPDATGYEVDKMSKKHAETHFNTYVGEMLRRIPEKDRRTFKVLVQDSYEVGGQNFTDNLIPDFTKRYGYDPTPYLPVLNGIVVSSQHDSDAFLWDLRRFIADRISYEYVGGTREVAHKHGLTTWLENYGHWGFPGEFLQYGGQADEVGGEFWADPPYGEIENRLATSCSHIYGKKLTSSESSTSAGPAYLRTPNDLKQRMDRYSTYGINNTVLHLYIHQPGEERLPGSNAWFGTEFDRNNIWFKQMDLYTTYIKRCNYMMRQGWYQADVAYFIGEDAPRMVGIMEPWIPAGYQFEHINAEVIIRDLSVKDGRLVLPHGVSFKVLVLPPKLKTMRPELLEKIEELVAAGAIVLGPAPERSPSLENQPEADRKVKELAEKLWGDVDGVSVKQRQYGKGIICHGVNFEELFAQLGYAPDCKVPAGTLIYQGHQKDGNTDIYILSNQENYAVTMDVEFRLTGKQPELWVPLTGEIRKLPAFTHKQKTTVVPMKLEKGECVFVVFRETGKPVANIVEANFPSPVSVQKVQSTWNVTFESAFKNPDPIKMDVLQDLATVSNDRVKYFSGMATYTTNANLKKAGKGERMFINFDKVGAMGKIYINGKYAGGVWTTPYKLDVTDFVKNGMNEIKVEVVNTWVNRIVGDLNAPESERRVYCFINPHRPDSPLPASGLIGQVVFETIKY
ncbi:glycosyl hydrolase [Bacteroides sp.]|uniref:glycosyl hydrolase n=1 Tax=Bacteroides sp. TaxID=29523 RepID=UPI0026061A7E|nr:glycosyl hydrolase [Bacteroides sp.]MDD3038342.1 glycosyl hydrolase [Bacteroides sp.]